jgi:hypothetical protein
MQKFRAMVINFREKNWERELPQRSLRLMNEALRAKRHSGFALRTYLFTELSCRANNTQKGFERLRKGRITRMT